MKKNTGNMDVSCSPNERIRSTLVPADAAYSADERRKGAPALSRARGVLLACLMTAGLCSAQVVSLPPSLAEHDAVVETVFTSLAFPEGPACNSAGELCFSEVNEQRIWKVGLAGERSIVRDSTKKSNGLAFDADDRLIACETNRLTRIGPDSVLNVLVEDTVLGSANDLALTPEGGIYFTAPVWDGAGSVWYLSPRQQLHQVLRDQEGYPNGIEYVDSMLYIAFSQHNSVRRYEIVQEDSVVLHDTLITLTTPDGGTIDELGNLWIASFHASKILAVTPQGDTLGSITIDNENNVTNCCFGGPEHSTLFITAATAVYRVELNVQGRSAPSATRQTYRTAPPASLRHSPSLILLRHFPATPSSVFDLRGTAIDAPLNRRVVPGCYVRQSLLHVQAGQKSTNR